MDFTYVISPDRNIYPNLTVHEKSLGGEFAGWEVRANEGYVFYDANANDVGYDPETMEEIPVTYYYVIRSFPKTYNWANFALVAVPRDSVPEDMIFGGGDEPEHEIM